MDPSQRHSHEFQFVFGKHYRTVDQPRAPGGGETHAQIPEKKHDSSNHGSR